jgi:hypothetical protein
LKQISFHFLEIMLLVCYVLAIFFLVVHSFSPLDVYVPLGQDALSDRVREEPVEEAVKDPSEFDHTVCRLSIGSLLAMPVLLVIFVSYTVLSSMYIEQAILPYSYND